VEQLMQVQRSQEERITDGVSTRPKRPSKPEPADAEHVGIILVHGVGEQRRFQHLDSELRNLIRALRAEAKGIARAEVSVDLAGAAGAAFHADQDTWSAGRDGTVRIVVKGFGPRDIHFHVHEVWWADVNEPYSLGKQFRFWLWGLSVWRYPAKTASTLASAGAVMPPTLGTTNWFYFWTRLRLFGVSAVFALLGFSLGTLTFLAKRLFGLEAPHILRVVTNYVSGVKLYNQRRRFGPGLVPGEEEFLDAIGEPPRVSVRRRMIRAIADVASNGYDRWHILAHSLGSVVAFNGLMETAWAWPGYLSRQHWKDLLDCEKPLAGPHKPGWPRPTGETVPRRPVWAGADGVVYRRRIFERFRGIITYGCPLDKFAAIWPARVPISREPGFQPGTVWINVFDPIDPVSGPLDAFSKQPERCCPHPRNVGYAASPWLLLSHSNYLSAKTTGPDLATCAVRWLLETAPPPGQGDNRMGGLQFARGSARSRQRSIGAWTSWIVAFVLLALLGGIVFPLLVKAVVAAAGAIWKGIGDTLPA
jgi:hypothetical protein